MEKKALQARVESRISYAAEESVTSEGVVACPTVSVLRVGRTGASVHTITRTAKVIKSTATNGDISTS